MADTKLDRFHLALMEDVLPVGLAMADRIKKGGFSNVANIFQASDSPINDLRDEGDAAAKAVRDQLDNVSPGLGNPVMSVSVGVQDPSYKSEEIKDSDQLSELLLRIESRLNQLDSCLNDKT